eukprot:IDg4552t1
MASPNRHHQSPSLSTAASGVPPSHGDSACTNRTALTRTGATQTTTMVSNTTKPLADRTNAARTNRGSSRLARASATPTGAASVRSAATDSASDCAITTGSTSARAATGVAAAIAFPDRGTPTRATR